MLRTIAYFKSTASAEIMKSAIEQCNRILCLDFGMALCLNYFPDLLMIAKNGSNEVIGLSILHYAESSKAWEVGTVSALKSYNKEDVIETLIQGACDAIRVLQKYHKTKHMWIVRRVKLHDVKQKALFKRLGFDHPENWMENLLSDSGYIPFDPFDTALMKMAVCDDQA